MNYDEIENWLKTQSQRQNNSNDTQLPTFEILSYIRVLKAENTKLLNANKELSDKVANLEVENEVFKRDAENLERTIEECNDELHLYDAIIDKYENGRFIEVPYSLGEQVYFRATDINHGSPKVYCGKVVGLDIDVRNLANINILLDLEYGKPARKGIVSAGLCFKTMEQAMEFIERTEGE
jgi:hypothetical protein